MGDEIVKDMIYIGVPRERVYLTEFIDNRDNIIYNLQKSGNAAGLFSAEGHRVDRNRDTIVEKFLEHKNKPPWLLMLDSDMEHPVDTPLRLVRWNVPIVGGLYFHRGTHDPLAFMESDPEPDKYGRMSKQWLPIRDEAFKFLSDHRVPMKDGAVSVNSCLYSPLMKIHAIGTGCIMIHREVLEKMAKPIFEYRDYGNSEDLVFCYEARHNYGYDIHVDLSTICGHYHWVAMGQAQFRNLYIGRGIGLTSYTPDQAAKMLSEFLGTSLENAQERLKNGNAHMVGDYWALKYKDGPPAPQEELAFYSDSVVGSLYIIELLHWNASQGFGDLQGLLTVFRDQKILEFGGGIGTVSMQLAIQNNDVTCMEINEQLRKFAEYRWGKLLKDLSTTHKDIRFMDASFDPEPGQYDVVIAYDFFEHLSEEECRHYIWRASNALRYGGRLVYHNNFGQQNIYPMHHNYTDKWKDWLIEFGFIPTTDVEAVKAVAT